MLVLIIVIAQVLINVLTINSDPCKKSIEYAVINASFHLFKIHLTIICIFFFTFIAIVL